MMNNLKGSTVRTYLKLKKYAAIRDYVDDVIKKSLILQNLDVMKDIFDSANLDLTAQDSNLHQAILSVLDLLLKCSSANIYIKELPTVYLELTFSDSLNDNQAIKTVAYNCLCSCIKVIIMYNICDIQPLFLLLSNKSIQEKVLDLLLEAYTDLSLEKSVVFFYEKNVCTMFESSNSEVRDGLIKLNNQLLPKYKITLLSNNKFDKFKSKVRRSYVPRIVELRCSKDLNWSRLFKFILNSFGKLLHIQVDVINDLLKAVESAFRSSNLDDRFEAFECWKELINNYSLDMNRLCGAKQMKLLITPLKTNISTNDLIIYKRFEIWVHLFNILQDKASVCLEQFLQFCFGDTNDSPNLDNVGVCTQNSQLFEGITQAIFEIMGHYQHTDINTCFKFPKSFLELHKPLVDEDNFVRVASCIVHSVAKCSTVILQWINVEYVSKVIHCLWGSLFYKVTQVDGEEQEQILDNITTKLQTFVESSNCKMNYQYIVMPILQLLVKENFFEKQLLRKTVFFPLIKSLLDDRTSICLTDNHVLSDFIKFSKDFENIEAWLEQAFDVILNSKTNFHNVFLLWTECADYFYFQKFDGDSFLKKIPDFMTWPLTSTGIPSKELNNEFIKVWKITFKYVSKLFPTQVLGIIEKLQIVSSPENVSMICIFYKVFCQTLESGDINGFEAALFQLTQNLLTQFTLRKCDVSLLLPAIRMFASNMISNNDTSNFIPLCNCFTVLLDLYKKIKLLDTLEEIVDKIPLKIPASLSTAISNMKDDMDDNYNIKVDNILKKLNICNDKNLKVKSPSSRGKKLVAMMRKNLPNVKCEPSSLQLFGQNVLSPNHTDIRGSHLNGQADSNPKKAVNKLNTNKNLIVNEDDKDQYLLVDTEYNFNPEKLSEHQLEVLKHRSSDIPALYQDLTQSQSNFGSSNSNSKLTDLNCNRKPSDESNKGDDLNEERVNLHVRNPSEEQIEAMIRSSDSVDLVKDIGIDDEKKRERVEKELMKLKLDVVGGEFVHNIDLLGKRETRRKSEHNFKQYRFLKTKCSPKSSGTLEKFQSKRIRGKPRNILNSVCKRRNSIGDKLNEVADHVNVSVPKDEENVKEAQSEDVIESSQKLQDGNEIGSNGTDILNSKFEEVVSKFPRFKFGTVEQIIEKSVDLTEEYPETCDMETETISLCNEPVTPIKAIDIPTSPVQADTPTRTSLLIKDTVDISPIKIIEDNEKTQELFESQTIDNIVPTNKENDIDLQVVQQNGQDFAFINRRLKKAPTVKSITPVNKRIFSKQTHRVMKMMKKCEKKLDFHDQVKEKTPVKIISDEDCFPEEFFKFIRELPSPMASPKCSILKRKACELTDDGVSPPRKKRVNFPDPPLTSKMVYVPDVNEHSHVPLDPTSLFVTVDDNEDDDKVLSEETQLEDIYTQGSVPIVDAQLLNTFGPVFDDLVDCKDDVRDVVMQLSDSTFRQSLLDDLHAKNICSVGDLARLSEVEINRLPIKSPKLTNLCDVLRKHELQKSVKEEANRHVEIKTDDDDVRTDHESNKPVIVQPKQKRRVPLIAVTEGDCSNENNFKPLLLEPVLVSTQKELKPEDVLNKLIEELGSVKMLAKKEESKLMALCKLLIEIVNPNELLNILRDNAAFRLSSLVKDPDWPKTLKEVIDSISLRRFVELLCNIPSISPSTILPILIDESIQTNKQVFNSPELQQTIGRLVEIASPSVALKHLTIRQIIDETHRKCNDSNTSTDFFTNAFRVFEPSLDDIVPSFSYIKIGNLQDKPVQRNEDDLFTFIQRVLTITDTSKASSLFSKEKMLPAYTRDELTNGIVKAATSPCDIVQSCDKLVQELPRAKTTDNTYESLAFTLFDKIPISDLCRYVSKHLSKFADTVQNNEQM